jgi:hypothetical protein
VGLVSYFAFFARFPATRDVPWINLPLVLAGVGLSAHALWRRRSFLSVAGLVLSAACAGLLAGYVFVLSEQLPDIREVVAVGSSAPEFALPDEQGQTVRLSDVAGRPLVLVFYRGFW